MTLLNHAATRKWVLQEAERIGRKGVITQVGATALASAEEAARAYLRQLIATHPGGFKTLNAWTS